MNKRIVIPAAITGVTLATVMGLVALFNNDGSSSPDHFQGPEGTQQEQWVDVAETPPSAEQLAPVIRATGFQGEMPQAVEIEFAVPVAQAEEVGEIADQAFVDVSPAVEGELRFTSQTTLRFTPRTEFRPGTRYSVALKKLVIKKTNTEFSDVKEWSHTFATAAFRLVRVSVSNLTKDRSRASFNITMSAPVELQDIQRLSTWHVDGKPVETVHYKATDRPSVVEATLRLTTSLSQHVRFHLNEGARLQGDDSVVAAEATEEVSLPRGEPMTILHSRLKEGENGFYLEIACDDAAVKEKRRIWRRSERSHVKVSKHCAADEESALSAIRFNPEVRFSVSPARHGFRITGDFARGSYTVTIDGGLFTRHGGVLYEPYQTSFTVPARKPRVRFAKKGRYLPRDAWHSLAVSHLNTQSVQLKIRHIRRENIVFWLSNSTERADERVSDLVLDTRVSLYANPDEETTTWLNPSRHLPGLDHGVFEVSLKGTRSHDTARLLLTNMNLIAKRSQKLPQEPYSRRIKVWSVDAHTTKPLSGTDVRLITKSNRTVASCATGSNGACVLKIDEFPYDKTPPFAITAENGEEFTFIRFADLKVGITEENVGGEPFNSAKKYATAIYSDRGVYRPGETAHLVAVLRDQTYAAPSAAVPVILEIIDPKRQVIKKSVLKTNQAGLVSLDVEFADFASTGQYTARASVGNVEVGSYKFKIEEFVPERMKVTAEARKGEYFITETPQVNVQANYLFGGSAKGSTVEVTCDLVPSEFRPAKNGNYYFGVWRGRDGAPKPIQLGTASGKIGADDQASIDCPSLGQVMSYDGPSRLRVQAAVFESGSGRTTTAQTSVPVHPERFYLGLSSSSSKAEAGASVPVKGVVVDWEGNVVNEDKPVRLEFLQLEAEYGYFYDPKTGRDRWQRMLHLSSTGTQDVQAKAGRFEATFTAGRYAEGYLIRATAGDAKSELMLDGVDRHYYWRGPSSRVDATPRPMKPVALDLKVPSVIDVNDTVKVSFKAPYQGRVLFTVETDDVLQSQWREVDAGETSWSFEIDEFYPNVYVSALLIKDPHLESDEAFMPDRAFGVRSVRVQPQAFTQALQVTVPDVVEPGKTLEVAVDAPGAEAGTYVTVAAVDEGILSLTGFQTPNPLETLFERRKLGIETFETIGWMVLVPPAGPSQRTGGDAAADPHRVQAVKPVALWSGVVPLDANGHADIQMKIPQYQGSLRVMAISVGKERVGRASDNVIVRSPLVAQTTLPRFLGADDRFEIPVFVTNMTGEAQNVTVSIEAEALHSGGSDDLDARSPLVIEGGSQNTLTLQDGASGRVVFLGKAALPSGAATLRVTAKAGKYLTVNTLDVPFYPSAPRSRMVKRIKLKAGETDLLQYVDGWMPHTENTTFLVTNNPYIDVFGHLQYLVRYPYGCIEQTTSSTRPLLFLPDLLSSSDPKFMQRSGEVDKMVKHGIDRVLSMQTPAGGFSYWPGGTHPHDWGTAYATHMLLDAKRLGHAVPESQLNQALQYIQNTLNGAGASTGYYPYVKSSTEAYMHYVLALANKARKGDILNRIKSFTKTDDGEQKEQLYLLKAALYLAGDHRYENDLLNPDSSGIEYFRRNGWSFYSDLRRRGFMLSIFGDLFGDHEHGESLAQRVADFLRQHKSGYYTTQELVWGITGLGKRIGAPATDYSPPTLIANGKTRSSVQEAGGVNTKQRSWNLFRAGEYQALSLNIPDAGSGNLYLLVNSEGVRKDATYEFGGNGLSIKQRVLDVDGKDLDLDGPDHELGKLLVVEVTIENRTDDRIQNIALVSRLPAAWEVENPRLGRSRSIDWLEQDKLWEFDHMNLRDDRVEYFGNLQKNETKKVVYMVRAVTAGSFSLPPVSAEAMYDPAIWARSPGGEIRILAPWNAAN